jgi:hypothetical protein
VQVRAKARFFSQGVASLKAGVKDMARSRVWWVEDCGVSAQVRAKAWFLTYADPIPKTGG